PGRQAGRQPVPAGERGGGVHAAGHRREGANLRRELRDALRGGGVARHSTGVTNFASIVRVSPLSKKISSFLSAPSISRTTVPSPNLACLTLASVGALPPAAPVTRRLSSLMPLTR